MTNRIFHISEIEDMIFDYLDQSSDLKNITMINKYYATIINQRPFYNELREFFRFNGHFMFCHFRLGTPFIRACCFGKLLIAKYINQKNPIDIYREQNIAFLSSCYNNHLDVAIWLYTVFQINIHECNEFAFRWSCTNGNLGIAIWLYNLTPNCPIDIKTYNNFAFEYSRAKKHTEVVSWLSAL
jgi:hypothetical protein